MFWICSHCDRGQRYCSAFCRVPARRQQRRRANRCRQRVPRDEPIIATGSAITGSVAAANPGARDGSGQGSASISSPRNIAPRELRSARPSAESRRPLLRSRGRCRCGRRSRTNSVRPFFVVSGVGEVVVASIRLPKSQGFRMAAMISAETRVQIRHLFFAGHCTIARQLQIHPDAARHAIESDRFNRAQAHLGHQSHFMGYRILSYGVPISPYAYTVGLQIRLKLAGRFFNDRRHLVPHNAEV